MSWNVYLLHGPAIHPRLEPNRHRTHDVIGGEPCYVERHTEGGIYMLGGNTEAELNVTYNYGAHFREAWPEPFAGPDGDDGDCLYRMLHAKRAGDTLPALEAAVAKLGTEPDGDYWHASPGNAGRALAILARWARQYPDAIWSVS